MEITPIKKYSAECIGTFMLVFCGTGAIIINQVSGGVLTHLGIAATFGLVVMALIDTLGDISGAHFNPAVTVAFWQAKRFPAQEVLPYIFSQVMGGILASTLLWVIFPEHTTLGATIPKQGEMQSFILEILLMFFLMFVILNVSSGSKEKGLTAAITIGAVVGLEAMFAGPISGASMNPARSLAPALVSGNFASLWIYLTAPFIGAGAAILGCRGVREKECCSSGMCVK